MNASYKAFFKFASLKIILVACRSAASAARLHHVYQPIAAAQNSALQWAIDRNVAPRQKL
jgi:hypothetical protein